MSDTYVNTTGSHQLPDGRWSHSFSQSLLSTFQRCPEQARAIFAREVTSEPTDSTSLGTACHEGWEYALHEKLNGSTPNVDDMVDVTYHKLDLIGEWKQTKMSVSRVYALVPTLMSTFVDNILPQVEPAEMERKFRVLLYSGKHREVWLNGTIDCVDQDRITPWDWKTASRTYETWEKQRWAIQPTVYCYALEQMEHWRGHEIGKIREPMTFVYGVALYNGDHQILTVRRDQSHLDWLKAQCSQVAWLIENNVRPWPMLDGGWHCSESWCPVFAAGECKGRFMVDGWKKAA